MCVESVSLVAGVEAGLVLPAPSTSAASSAKIHQGPPGISSSRSTVLSCKRAWDSIHDSDTMPKDGDEVDSAAKQATANGGHGWTRR